MLTFEAPDTAAMLTQALVTIDSHGTIEVGGRRWNAPSRGQSLARGIVVDESIWRSPSAETVAEYGPRECPWDWPETVGIHVGGCVDGNRRFRRQAHAHNYPDSKWFGWICVLSHRRLFAQSRDLAGNWHPTDRPSRLMLHERAHLLTPGHGHDHVWMMAAHRLGYRFAKHEKEGSPKSWKRFQAELRNDGRD